MIIIVVAKASIVCYMDRLLKLIGLSILADIDSQVFFEVIVIFCLKFLL